ncbi:MAG: hypothetical protein COU47_03090 [Candidatus Niyogibacteria bacterium CG10_big_fil_rev_8_21_14_0_10_46_36]|uniref:Uncharacterized protein n=1 Tax=Candidatus Niyogibacteria bacterium CG10_big_fil_rev_8_21_14_0_10_46_36 TaxID=1974726 RepID=A0A2H0TCQ2_9BACT|nr:MAG: hypothetical protein COU47_03090 [Candidatus Niyogibacteria bacterium CG10_big_fil_rev_8_21_14_0_10_46_36]
MYNPQNLHECEIEKKRNPRRIVDGLMTAIGGVASVSSIPQVIKIYETGTVSGISLTTQLVALFAVCSWFLYGLYIHNKPLAITSGLSILVLATVVVQIFIYQ